MRSFFGSGLAAQKFRDLDMTEMFSDLSNDMTDQALSPKCLIFGEWINKVGLTKKDRDINRRYLFFKQVVTKLI